MLAVSSAVLTLTQNTWLMKPSKKCANGNFLGEEHTFRHFRDEIWSPTLSERRSYEEWEADGAKDMKQVVAEKLVEILDNHQPEPLSEEILAKLDAIVQREEELLK